MNPKLSFYALMSSFAVIVAVFSAASANAVATHPDQTIEQRVSVIRDMLGRQNNQATQELQIREGENLISQTGWYNNWSNNPWSNSSGDGRWYNNWTNYNG